MNKLAFVFPGQGAQYPGMGKDFYENFQSSRDIYDKADEVLGFSLSDICFTGTAEQLAMTRITQPAILTTSIAMLDALLERIQLPDMTAGLSLGEYGSLICAQGLSFGETVGLVSKRGQYMQEAVPVGVGTMAAIMGLDKTDLEQVCRDAAECGIVEPGNFNCPGQIVIGGEIAAVERACQLAKERGAKRAIRLNVSAPFHTSMLHPAAEKLWGELGKVETRPLRIPVVTNINAEKITHHNHIKENLVKQVMNPVLWQESVEYMIAEGIDTFVEIGPGNTLAGFIRKINKEVTVYNVCDMDSYEQTVSQLEELGYGKDRHHHWSREGYRQTDRSRAI